MSLDTRIAAPKTPVRRGAPATRTTPRGCRGPAMKHRIRIRFAANRWRWRCYRPATGWVCHADHDGTHSDALTRALAHLTTHCGRAR